MGTSNIKKIIILGTGGNCIDILETIQDINRAKGFPFYECVGFLDDNPEVRGQDIHGVKVLGGLTSADDFSDCFFVNGIGSAKNFRQKDAIVLRAGIDRDRFEAIVHPTAAVSPSARLGRGTVLFQGVTVCSNVCIGDHVMVLPHSIISHNDRIGDYTIIAGGVCISGDVTVGKCCYIGTNSSIREKTRLGDRCLVGMGSVVLRDVPENRVVAGNPARMLKMEYQNSR